MTMENWNDIETTCLTSTVHPAICLSYLISWIFVGNYVLLNLLLAIVMDSFNDDEINEDKEEYLKGLQVEQDIAFNNQVDGTSVFNQTTMLLNQSGY